MKSIIRLTCTGLLFLSTCQFLVGQGVQGYYQYPAIHGNTVYFTAEGDLWRVPLTGGQASRLTTHHGTEVYPAVSPDGKWLAFSAIYEGPSEVYVMPVEGGLPTRLTYDRDASLVTGWTQDGHIMYTTRQYSGKPEFKLVTVNPDSYEHTVIPLNLAGEGFSDPDGAIYFVNPTYHHNVTKRYKGGTARQIWRFKEGEGEAVKLTTDYAGESHNPMWWNDRVYFITDRDGIMNVWSMTETGDDLTQHTNHKNFDVREADLHNGHIVYKHGADLWHLDLSSGKSTVIPITLNTDLDQMRENWEENPMRFLTSAELDSTGENVVLTARGRVFVAPADGGRLIQASRAQGVRYRDAVFSADGSRIITLSDESGEFEFVSIPANGVGNHEALTDDGEILRYKGVPSKDGKWIAYDDLLNRLWLLNIATGEQKVISTNEEGIGTIRWSPDDKWVAFEQNALNTFMQLIAYNVETGSHIEFTSDRANSVSPSWSHDGEFLYFLSDRHFRSLVGSPWGSRQPEPYFDQKWKVYHVALQPGTRSPFRPGDELFEDSDEKPDSVVIEIDADGLISRTAEVPIKPGNYRGLMVNKSGLFMLSSGTGIGSSTDLVGVKFTNDNPKATTIAEGVRSFSFSGDAKKMLVRKGSGLHVIDAKVSKADLSDAKVDLSDWKFPIDVKEDWKQIYTDAWRMERDYFYDENMHGVDWDKMYEKYLPMLDRVTTRLELSDVIGRFVGELAALHTSVRGGDIRSAEDDIDVADLGAYLERDAEAGGYVIKHIYQSDPEYPNEKSPLADPYLDISEGEVITAIDGDATLEAVHIGQLLRNKAGKQILVSLKSAEGESRDVIVEPLSNAYNLRYREWEYTRRLEAEEASENRIGYVHLRAMGSNDISQWYREFYPVYNRQGLIIDVRHNRGGNIESFILEKLMRKTWMWWAYRAGEPYGNMQYAFNGHIVVLCDEFTASDGEAFSDGFRRLDLGTTIGTRTWGGEIWLHSGNRLSDNGIARAPMHGVYADGEWLIEGHGFVPDIEVKNMPHATFNGEDAQLDAAIEFLMKKMEEEPVVVPDPPAYPDKSFNNN